MPMSGSYRVSCPNTNTQAALFLFESSDVIAVRALNFVDFQGLFDFGVRMWEMKRLLLRVVLPFCNNTITTAYHSRPKDRKTEKKT